MATRLKGRCTALAPLHTPLKKVSQNGIPPDAHTPPVVVINTHSHTLTLLQKPQMSQNHSCSFSH